MVERLHALMNEQFCFMKDHFGSSKRLDKNSDCTIGNCKGLTTLMTG